MPELVYYVAVSLDGFIAAPDGNFDAFPIELDHGEFVETLPGHALSALGITPSNTRFGSVIMGWSSYTPAITLGIDSPYPHLRQFVATRSERDVPGEITLTRDPVATVRELKSEGDLDVYLCGGGELAGTLINEIDRLVLKRNPLVFGDGIPLFGRRPYQPAHFDPVARRQLESGVSVEQYVPRRG